MNTSPVLSTVQSRYMAVDSMPDRRLLRETLRLIKNSNSALHLDLSRLPRLNAAGLGILLKLQRAAVKRGVALYLADVSESVSMFLELTRADAVFSLTDARERTLPRAA